MFQETIFSYREFSNDITDEVNENQNARPHNNIDMEQNIKRPTRRLTWLNDYVSIVIGLGHIGSPQMVSTADLAFMTKVATIKEPSSYNQGKGNPDWEMVMQHEIDALKANNTWELTELPLGKKAIARNGSSGLNINQMAMWIGLRLV